MVHKGPTEGQPRRCGGSILILNQRERAEETCFAGPVSWYRELDLLELARYVSFLKMIFFIPRNLIGLFSGVSKIAICYFICNRHIHLLDNTDNFISDVNGDIMGTLSQNACVSSGCVQYGAVCYSWTKPNGEVSAYAILISNFIQCVSYILMLDERVMINLIAT